MPSYNFSYTYDAAGNRKTRTNNLTGVTTDYVHNAANQLIEEQVLGATTVKYAYDAKGNRTKKEVVGGDSTFYEYDQKNHLTKASPPSGDIVFTYNADGQRVKKETPSETRKFIYDLKKLLQETDGDDATQNLITATTEEYGDLISEFDGSNSSYHQYDALGSTDALLDDNETTTDRYEYTAFGLQERHIGSSTSPLTFVGQQNYYRDSELDLYILGMGNANGGGRGYDPATGTFLSKDPAEVDLNPYRYAENNPVNGIDPSGAIFVTKDKDEADEFVKKLQAFKGTQRETCDETMQHVSNIECCGWWYIHTDERDALLLSNYAKNNIQGDKAYNNFMLASGAMTKPHWEMHIYSPAMTNVDLTKAVKTCIFEAWEKQTKGYTLMPVKIDVGGEGKHLDAINLNPSRTKITTFKEGDPIPRQYIGRDADMPAVFAGIEGLTIDVIYVERTLQHLRPRGFAGAVRKTVDDTPNGSFRLRILERSGAGAKTLIRNLIVALNRNDDRKSNAAIDKIIDLGEEGGFIYVIRFIKVQKGRKISDVDFPEAEKPKEPVKEGSRKPDCK